MFVDLLAYDDPHWSITLPPLIGASYGRGNWLAMQRERLEIMGGYEQDKALKLAEICAAQVLAEELSLFSAILSGD